MHRKRHSRNPSRMLGNAMRWRTPDKDVIALSLLTAGESMHAGSAYLPSWFTVKSFALQQLPGDPLTVQQKVANFRSGYLPAVLFGLGMGVVVSVIAEHPLPVIMAAGTSTLMIAAYESALPSGIRMGTAQPPVGPMPGAGLASPPLPNVGGS